MIHELQYVPIQKVQYIMICKVLPAQCLHALLQFHQVLHVFL